MAGKTKPFSGAGTTLGYSTASTPTTFTNISMLIDLDAPETSVDDIDTTPLAATITTSMPTIPSNGPVTFNVFYVPGSADVAFLATLATSGQTITWQIQTPDGSGPSNGTTLTFLGYVKSWKPSNFKVKDKPIGAVTVTVTGAIAIGAAS